MTDRTKRLDVLSFYSIIRNAYSFKAPEEAHQVLEANFLRYGGKDKLILYIDGGAAVEKEETAKKRKANRDKAAEKCYKNLDTLEQRVTNNQKARKRHFVDVKKSLASLFYWPSSVRQDFIDYLIKAGWTVRICETEADVAIAADCRPEDIVISADSDMLAYGTIYTLWRPISRGLHLAYSRADVCQTLGLSSAQLTALACVVSNDYGRNIFSLGPVTSLSVIMNSKGEDPRSIVSEYLENERVQSKNTCDKTFELALRVFADQLQTPSTCQISDSAYSSFNALRQRFMDLCKRYQQNRSLQMTFNSSNSMDIIRLRSSSTSNRYKTVESPAIQHSRLTRARITMPPPVEQPQDSSISHGNQTGEALHPALQRTRTPRHQPRYSFKSRKGTQEHPRPPVMKQLAYKPYKEPETKRKKETSAPKDPPTLKTLSKSTAATDKLAITRHLAYHHPTSSLSIGTLKANIRLALPNQLDLQQEVMEVIQGATSEAARVKREAQRLIGCYVEKLDKIGIDHISSVDKEILRHLCQPVSMEDVKDTDDIAADEEDDNQINGLVDAELDPDDGEPEVESDDSDLQPPSTSTTKKKKDDKVQAPFIWSFLRVVYSGKRPRPSSMGDKVNAFIDRLTELGIYVSPSVDINESNMPFTPTDLVRSMATQLKAELEKMYKHGTCIIHNKLKKAKDLGILDTNTQILIRDDVSAVENYVSLNKLIQQPRRIAPMTSVEQPFVGFTERELAGFFMKRGGDLKTSLTELASNEGVAPTIQDVQEWVGTKEPGYLLKRYLADIDPSDLTSRKKGKAGHRAAIKLMSLKALRRHLRMLDDPTFDPKDYTVKGYVSRGSILTDGFRVYLLAYKLRELQCVRYRRLPPDRLPPRISSTVGGTDSYLQEIRNVVKDDMDFEKLWPGARPTDIKILTLDAGQAFVVGAYAYLPGRNGALSTTMDISVDLTRPTDAEQDGPVHLNLAVNQKAVMQPVFRYRRWLNTEKGVVTEAEPSSISDIESNLPPLRGSQSSVEEYVRKIKEVEERLSTFYNGRNRRFKRHTWDMKRAKHAEYQAIAERLLRIVGGTTGRHRDPNNHVIIGVGLGQFKSSSRLSSLHSSFLDYFIPLARSLGYLVVGINEYYTSQKCPNCHNFIARVTIRQLYCTHCKHFHHRDIMAAENMAMIVRERLEKQERPLHLQPVTEDGIYPWISESDENTGDSHVTASTSVRGGRSKATKTGSRSKARASSTVKSHGKGPPGAVSHSISTTESEASAAASASSRSKSRASKRQAATGEVTNAVDTHSSLEMSSIVPSDGPSRSRKRASSLNLSQEASKMAREL
ncbi:putative transposase [Entomortierella parvispora]|uniref:Transposase n=1 Tax=Entomortierella parvispora TaxID=205924 RepID=A0A9P3HIZ9_9FUNG|nr:putative transposase [Entomortierella parvispora]